MFPKRAEISMSQNSLKPQLGGPQLRLQPPVAAPASPTAPTARKVVRVAVIGCGAISRQFHLPILAGHEHVTLATLVDRDLKRAEELARGYGVARVVADAAELTAQDVDAAVIATPPFHHAPCAKQLMQRGIHVLVEKPMATSYTDAQAMVRTAQEHGVTLAV